MGRRSFGRIIGVGIDTTSISRMHRLLTKHGEPFVQRIFHPSEIDQCPLNFSEYFATTALQDFSKQQQRIAQYYASRWAAKEATIKALGFSGIGSKQIYVYKQKPSIVESASNKVENIVLNNSITKLYPPLLKLEGREISKIIGVILEEKQANGYAAHLSLSHDGDMAIANVVIEVIYNSEEENK